MLANRLNTFFKDEPCGSGLAGTPWVVPVTSNNQPNRSGHTFIHSFIKSRTPLPMWVLPLATPPPSQLLHTVDIGQGMSEEDKKQK